jgi:hypothetical protein
MTDTTTRDEAIDRLREIRLEIEELVDEAMDCLRDAGGSTDRAESYWRAHIICALHNDHHYLGGNMCTLQDTIDELEADDGPEPDDDDEA